MLANTFLNEIKISLLDLIVIFLCIFILKLSIKLIKTKMEIYDIKYIIKIAFMIMFGIFSFALIISGVIFFYKTAMLKMLVPSGMGILFLIIEFIMYVLLINNKEDANG